MKYPHVFSPLKLNQLTLPNRIYSTAHAEVYAEAGGLPGDRYIRYYEEKAKGGLGMAICGGSSPGHDSVWTEPHPRAQTARTQETTHRMPERSRGRPPRVQRDRRSA